MPKLFVQLLQLTYRYAVLLAGEARRVRVGMAVRGFRIRPTMRTYTAFGNLIGSLFVRAGERSEIVTHAMQARGFDGTYRSLTSFQTTRWDVYGFVFVVLSAIGIIRIETMERG